MIQKPVEKCSADSAIATIEPKGTIQRDRTLNLSDVVAVAIKNSYHEVLII